MRREEDWLYSRAFVKTRGYRIQKKYKALSIMEHLQKVNMKKLIRAQAILTLLISLWADAVVLFPLQWCSS